ncbi:hypothetical protein [Ilumatobacter coccineus]|uniref:Uncharacterized protein n=1 Tax=Ilumatobacter coccineus (strain NBRC 103263 / KCTC 29153 / YM16-304) TaxID=1313172 RepID=A0A6C7ED68_ILUCY|nr:hypothetical protein [Ilumatobacter coccineus]BAN04401.1 hypothetical protein YM304_40870 [Ilumatobacter coccineus YM16-304]
MVGAIDLEGQLRRLLRDVDLVCDAAIPSEMLDAAEQQVREASNSDTITEFGRRRPATLVAYFALRGPERYQRNSIWSELGVVGNTSLAGAAFLRALVNLGLRTFQDETTMANARRYVAPLLIHGAIPSSKARTLVERLEMSLRRGVVDASEARGRLERDPYLVKDLGRPASRLIQWAPEYAESLIETVFEYIEDPSGAALGALPHHIRQALNERPAERTKLKRIRPPEVWFEYWTGFGPEITINDPDTYWRIRIGGKEVRTSGTEPVELTPTDRAETEARDRRFELWKPAPAWFFHADGRPLKVGELVPTDCVVLLPLGFGVCDPTGQPIRVIEEGVPLSGSWSKHHAVRIDLVGVTELLVAPRAGGEPVVRRQVNVRVAPELAGEVVLDAIGADGRHVFASNPSIRAPHSANEAIQVRYSADDGTINRATLVVGADGVVSMSSVFPAGAHSGRLEVRGAGETLVEHVTVVPGLIVDVDRQFLRPDQESVIEIAADEGVLDQSGTIPVQREVSMVPLSVNGLKFGVVSARVPRVQWGIRSDAHRRLELAPGLIRTNVDSLTAGRIELLVRLNTPATVSLILSVDGDEVQRTPARKTSAIHDVHHNVSVDLAVFRDTLRHQHTSYVTLDLDLDGQRMTAIECGDRPASAAVAARQFPLAPAPPVRERQEARRRAAIEAGLGDHSMAVEFLVEGAAGFSMFLRALGEVSRSQPDQVSTDAGSAEWTELNEAARQAWNMNGIRLRDFVERSDLGRSLAIWAVSHHRRILRMSDREARVLREWLVGNTISSAATQSWAHRGWVEACLPTASDAPELLFPATVLYHCVRLAAGDETSAAAVTQAAEIDQVVVIGAGAFLTEVVRRRNSLEAIDSSTEALAAVESADAGDDEEELDELASLDECVLDIDGRMIQLLPDRPVRPPSVRLLRRNRAVAVLKLTQDDDMYVAELPTDLAGCLTPELVTGDLSAPRRPRSDLALDVSSGPGSAGKPQRVETLSELATAMTDQLVDRIVDSITAGAAFDDLIEALFEDEQAAAAALVRLADRIEDPAIMNLVAAATAPSLFLFSWLGVSQARLHELRDRRLLYVCLAPRTPHEWAPVGWPAAAPFEPTASTLGTFVSWALQQSDGLEITSQTWTYAAGPPHSHPLVGVARERLLSHGVDTAFINVALATERMLADDILAVEARRMVLAALRANPAAARNAAIVGIALHLITRG